MRKRSPAKSAASSPPVPARISRIALFSSASSLAKVLRRGLERVDGRGPLLLGKRAHLRIVHQRIEAGEVLGGTAVGPDRFDHGIELRQLARERDEGVRGLPGGERRRDDVVAGKDGVEPVRGRCDCHGLVSQTGMLRLSA
jgi:hypothetical protein